MSTGTLQIRQILQNKIKPMKKIYIAIAQPTLIGEFDCSFFNLKVLERGPVSNLDRSAFHYPPPHLL